MKIFSTSPWPAKRNQTKWMKQTPLPSPLPLSPSLSLFQPHQPLPFSSSTLNMLLPQGLRSGCAPPHSLTCIILVLKYHLLREMVLDCNPSPTPDLFFLTAFFSHLNSCVTKFKSNKTENSVPHVTSHLSNAQEPHTALGYHVGECGCSTFLSSQKASLFSTDLEIAGYGLWTGIKQGMARRGPRQVQERCRYT